MKPVMLPLAVALVVIAASVAEAQTWQGNLANNDPITLSVRFEGGEIAYNATFVVTLKGSNKKFVKKIHIEPDEWGTVRFPTDFAGASETAWIEGPRRFYEWECQVKGKRILYGDFYYPNFKLDFDKADL
jgi:hypothetical protein